jgi:hypothetical protein
MAEAAEERQLTLAYIWWRYTMDRGMDQDLDETWMKHGWRRVSKIK